MRFSLESTVAVMLAVWLTPSLAVLGEEVIEDTVEIQQIDTRTAAEQEAFAAQGGTASQDASGSLASTSERAHVSAGKISGARGKNKYAIPDPALGLFDPRTYRLKVVIRIDAPDGTVRNVVATGPIPMDWPEQRVRLISEKLSPQSKCTEQILPGQAALIKFTVPQISQGGSAFVERMYEITRYRTKFALNGEGLRLPRSVPAELKDQVAGEPPGIELKNPKMIELADSLRKTSDGTVPWETLKSFWSWTRDNVKFENGDFRGAMYAVDNRCGDCEEMSALFVGLCRLSGIPARTVWVEGHDYPEFYLLDAQGKGHWIPAQVVGPPWFGEITEYRPIFQKGDRFYDPLQKGYVRYVPHTVKGADGKAVPKVDFRHEIIADSDINGPSYSNAK